MGLFGFGKKEKDKMKDGLEKTRTGFWGNILNTLTGSKIDDDLYDELEEQLILADVGRRRRHEAGGRPPRPRAGKGPQDRRTGG